MHRSWVTFFLAATVVGPVFAGPDDPPPGPVVVSGWQLDELKGIVERMLNAVKTATLSNNNAEVIPRQKDRDSFVQDMEAIRRVANGRNGFEQWISDIRRQEPIPSDSRKYYVKDFQVMGFGADENAAAEDLKKECKNLENLMKDAYEANYAGLSCGMGAQKYLFDSNKVTGLASRAIVMVRVGKTTQVESRNGDYISSGNLEAGARNYRAWAEACKGWLFDQFNGYGEKLVGATCGVIDNPSNYYYQSLGRVFLKK